MVSSVQLSVSAEWKRTKKRPEWLSRPSLICKGSCLSRARQLPAIALLFANKQPLAPPSLSVCFSSFIVFWFVDRKSTCVCLDYSTSRCQSIDTGDIKRREHVKDVGGVNYFEKICLRRNLVTFFIEFLLMGIVRDVRLHL